MERLIVRMGIGFSLIFCIACSKNSQSCGEVDRIVKVIKIKEGQLRLRISHSQENYFLETMGDYSQVDESILLVNNSIPDSVWLNRDTLIVVYNNLQIPSNEVIRKGLFEYFNSHEGRLGSYTVIHKMGNRNFFGSHTSLSRVFDSIDVSGENLTFYNQSSSLGTVRLNDLVFVEGYYSVAIRDAKSDVVQYKRFEPKNERLRCDIYKEWLTW